LPAFSLRSKRSIRRCAPGLGLRAPLRGAASPFSGSGPTIPANSPATSHPSGTARVRARLREARASLQG
jgi:hypothetical protein